MKLDSISLIPKKYPYLWALLCLLIVGFPQWFQSVWSLFRTDAPIPIVRDWLKTMHMTIPEFSGYWVTVPLGLIMFGWLVYELRLQRTVPTISAGKDNETTQATPSTPFPDWPIRELFFYLRPDLVDDHRKNLWEKVGLEIRDNLAVGRLLIWGRKRDALPGKRSNFSLIPAEYWKPEIDFTYWFLDDGHQHACHVDPPTKFGLPGYSDLHVNKAQAMAVWSPPKSQEHTQENERPFEYKMGEETATFTEKLISFDFDVVKINAHTHIVGVAAEYAWIDHKYPNSDVIMQRLVTLQLVTGTGNNKPEQVRFDVIQLRFSNGRNKEIYFDVSNFFNDVGSSFISADEFIAQKISELYK